MLSDALLCAVHALRSCWLALAKMLRGCDRSRITCSIQAEVMRIKHEGMQLPQGKSSKQLFLQADCWEYCYNCLV